MPVKLVVTKGRSGKVVVTLQSSGGKKLLASGPLDDRRVATGLLRSLKPVLGDGVTVDDQTKAGPAKATASKKTAAGTTKRTARTAASASKATRATKSSKAPRASGKNAPATRKAAAAKAPATRTRRTSAKRAAAGATPAPAPTVAPTTNGTSTVPTVEETVPPIVDTQVDAG